MVVVPTCPFLSQHGTVVYSTTHLKMGFKVGTQATLSCRNGFSPSGPLSATCLLDQQGTSAFWTQFGTCEEGNYCKHYDNVQILFSENVLSFCSLY